MNHLPQVVSLRSAPLSSESRLSGPQSVDFTPAAPPLVHWKHPETVLHLPPHPCSRPCLAQLRLSSALITRDRGSLQGRTWPPCRQACWSHLRPLGWLLDGGVRLRWSFPLTAPLDSLEMIQVLLCLHVFANGPIMFPSGPRFLDSMLRSHVCSCFQTSGTHFAPAAAHQVSSWTSRRTQSGWNCHLTLKTCPPFFLLQSSKTDRKP